MECTDDVLGLGMIDPDLAPDRAVHLGQQGRRDHDQGNSPGIRGRDESRKVADHSTAQGDDRGMAVGLVLDELIEEGFRRGEALAGLAGRDPETRCIDADLRQGVAIFPPESQGFQVVIGDDEGRAAGSSGPGRLQRVPDEGPELVRFAGHHPDLVRARTELHRDADILIVRESRHGRGPGDFVASGSVVS